MSVYNYFDGFIKMSEKARECADYLSIHWKNKLKKFTI